MRDSFWSRYTIRAILECLGLPSRAPPIAAAEAEADDIDPDDVESDLDREHT